jgi:cell division topological specificity factor
MRLGQYFGFGKKSAKIAKDRLHIIIAQSRRESSTPDFLPLLRKDILEAIAKYTKIDMDLVKVDLQCKDNNSVLELNVTLPDLHHIEETV